MYHTSNKSKKIVKYVFLLFVLSKIFITIRIFSESNLLNNLYPFSIFSVTYILALFFAIPDEAILPLLIYLFALLLTWLASFVLLLFKKTFRVAMVLVSIVTLSDAVSYILSYMTGESVQQKMVGATYNVIIILSIIVLQFYGYIKAKHGCNKQTASNKKTGDGSLS